MIKQELLLSKRAIYEAIEAGKTVEKVYVRQNSPTHVINPLLERLQRENIPYQIVPPIKIDKLAHGREHQGLIAFVSPITYVEVAQLLPSIYEKGESPLLLYIDGVTDVRNLGGIIRSAECLGIHGIILPTQNSAPLGPDAINTSAGAIFHVPFCRTNQPSQTLQFLKESGVLIIGCTEKGNKTIDEIETKQPVCLVIGGEELGISKEVDKFCKARVKIPLKGKVLSLNVGIAAAIMMYEVAKKRN